MKTKVIAKLIKYLLAAACCFGIVFFLYVNEILLILQSNEGSFRVGNAKIKKGDNWMEFVSKSAGSDPKIYKYLPSWVLVSIDLNDYMSDEYYLFYRMPDDNLIEFIKIDDELNSAVLQKLNNEEILIRLNREHNSNWRRTIWNDFMALQHYDEGTGEVRLYIPELKLQIAGPYDLLNQVTANVTLLE